MRAKQRSHIVKIQPTTRIQYLWAAALARRDGNVHAAEHYEAIARRLGEKRRQGEVA